jgi:hypothetical protein
VTRRAATTALAALALLGASTGTTAAAPIPAVPSPGATTTGPSPTDPKGTDVLGQLFGRDRYAGDLGPYPLSNYQLDWDIDTDTDIGPLPVPKPKGVGADIASTLANICWTLSLIIAKLAGGLFAWAFSVDFLTGPHGILNPIGRAARVMYRDLFGRELLYAAMVIAGAYCALTIRAGQHSRGFAVLGGAVAYCVIAVGITNNMAGVAAPVYRATHELSATVLSMRATGTISPHAAEREANQHIRNTFIDGPWQILEFGGLAHCVDPRVAPGGYPKPVLPDDPGPKVCRSNDRYARAFLAEAPGSDARMNVLRDIAKGTGRWDKTDSPAVDMMLEGNAYVRLAVAAGVLAGLVFVGAFILFAGIIIVGAAVFFAIGLAFAPVMAPAAFIPRYGEALVRFWLVTLGGLLVVGVVASLILGVLMIVDQAITAAAGVALPAGWAFLVNAVMFLAALMCRKSVMRGVRVNAARLERQGRGTGIRVAGWVAAPVAAAAGAAAGAWGERRGAAADAGDASAVAGVSAPAWTEPPRDHEPRGGSGAPPPPPPPSPAAPAPARSVPDRARIDA